MTSRSGPREFSNYESYHWSIILFSEIHSRLAPEDHDASAVKLFKKAVEHILGLDRAG
jgi:hypothetical protein